jgi:hypothetical protein
VRFWVLEFLLLVFPFFFVKGFMAMEGISRSLDGFVKKSVFPHVETSGINAWGA